jgi:type II secretory pathway pseudopilin PulG
MGKTILITLVVAIVVGAAAAFGGYKMGDSAGFERANQVRQQFAQQRQAGQGGQFTQGGAGAGSAGGFAGRALAMQGTVKSVEGDTVTITMGNRDVTVKLNDTTQILKSVTSTRTDLTAGAHVMITPEGDAGANSGTGGGENLTAASVTILPVQ